MNVSNTFLKLFWFSICFIGNLYQIIQISSDYFQYEIVTTIIVNFPLKFSAPAQTICFHETRTINWDKLLLIKPNIRDDLNISHLNSVDAIVNYTKRQSLSGTRKIQGIVFKDMGLKTRASVTYNSTEMFNDCSLVLSDGSTQIRKSCHELFNISTYRYSYTCGQN